jgi:hypothetical protein
MVSVRADTSAHERTDLYCGRWCNSHTSCTMIMLVPVISAFREAHTRLPGFVTGYPVVARQPRIHLGVQSQRVEFSIRHLACGVQYRTEQNRTEQNRTEQNRTEQGTRKTSEACNHGAVSMITSGSRAKMRKDTPRAGRDWILSTLTVKCPQRACHRSLANHLRQFEPVRIFPPYLWLQSLAAAQWNCRQRGPTPSRPPIQRSRVSNQPGDLGLDHRSLLCLLTRSALIIYFF